MFIITFPISHAHLRYLPYTTIGYKYTFVDDKSKECDLYLVDSVDNGIMLSPEGPNFDHAKTKEYFFLQRYVWTWTTDTPGVGNTHYIEHSGKCTNVNFFNPTGPDFVGLSHMGQDMLYDLYNRRNRKIKQRSSYLWHQ